MEERNSPFLSRLRAGLPQLVQRGIIGDDQAENILAYFEDEERSAAHSDTTAGRKSILDRIPAIVTGIAAVLIGIGLIFFYAAQWDDWSRTFKLAQIFLILAAIYAAAWFFLFVRRQPVFGRGLLLIGMIGYGAAIGLVAQVYHISSQPTNGVLAWLLGVVALSFVMREKWGYFLGLLLAFIWNSWEFTGYDNPNYACIALIAGFFYLFYDSRSPVGLALTAGFALWYFYQFQLHLFDEQAMVDGGDEVHFTAITFLHVPLGILLILWSRLQRRSFALAPAGIVAALGWLMLFAPFAFLTWPLDFAYHIYVFEDAARPFVIQHAALTIVAGILLYVVYQRNGPGDIALPGALLVYGVLVPLLPLGTQSVLLIATYGGMLAFFFGLLYAAYGGPVEHGVDRFFAHAFPIFSLFAKGIGLFILALESEEYYFAYGIGFLIFTTAVYLINRYAGDMIAEAGRKHRAAAIDMVCVLVTYLMLYVLSFRIDVPQNSIFEADGIVILLLGIFITVSIALFAVLALRGSDRIPLMLSGLIFTASLFVLVLANPAVPWPVYQLVFNLLLFILTAVLIYYSTRIGSVILANLAIAGLGLQILTRYLDIATSLGWSSGLFIITGLVLLAGGYILERNRRKLIESIDAEHGEEEQA